MKIIDLLNKIANDEELPKSFVYNHTLYNLNDDKYKDDENFSLLDSIRYDFKNLNDELEIIEEDKKIERIDNAYYHETQDRQNEIFKNKINEIIDYINKEK